MCQFSLVLNINRSDIKYTAQSSETPSYYTEVKIPDNL